MDIAIKSPINSLILLTALTTCCIHVNKYILSVLGFSYPTVFQGWQTLVAVILMRYILFDHITPLCWTSFLSHLPLFVSFVGGIVAGSKALSILPVPIIISVSNVIPAIEHLLRNFYISDLKKSVSVGACILCICTILGIFYSDSDLSEISSASVWISIHLLFAGVQSIYDYVFASSDLRPYDKLFYSNLFSLIVLAPSSLYLEEAFEALHFQERRQVSFLFGCVLSGVLGTILAILTIHLSAEHMKVLPASRSVACLISPFILPCFINSSTWVFIVSNVITVCLIPLDQWSFLDTPSIKKLKLSEHV